MEELKLELDRILNSITDVESAKSALVKLVMMTPGQSVERLDLITDAGGQAMRICLQMMRSGKGE